MHNDLPLVACPTLRRQFWTLGTFGEWSIKRSFGPVRLVFFVNRSEQVEYAWRHLLLSESKGRSEAMLMRMRMPKLPGESSSSLHMLHVGHLSMVPKRPLLHSVSEWWLTKVLSIEARVHAHFCHFTIVNIRTLSAQ